MGLTTARQKRPKVARGECGSEKRSVSRPNLPIGAPLLVNSGARLE
jgi:hypothetical protein